MIAVDDSIQSKIAVQYAADVYQALKDVKFHVMHIQPIISQYLRDEAKSKPKAYGELEKVNRKNAETAQRLLDSYKTQMVAASQIATRTRSDSCSRYQFCGSVRFCRSSRKWSTHVLEDN
jgi:hypothetical protein